MSVSSSTYGRAGTRPWKLLDERAVVGVAAVDDADALRGGDGGDLAELLDSPREVDDGVAAGELVQGELAVGGLEGQPGQHQPEDVRVVAREGLHAQMVHGQELREPFALPRGQFGEPLPYAGAQRFPYGFEGLVRVEVLP